MTYEKMMDSQQEVTPGQVKESIGESFQKDVLPFFKDMEKRTRRVGSRGVVIDLRGEKKC